MRCGPALPGDPQRGAGTVLVLGVIAVAILLIVALAGLASAQRARGSAQASADLAALAGAQARQHGQDACAVASQVAIRNGTDLGSCTLEPLGVILVQTRAEVSAGPFGALLGAAEARARAGPMPSGW